jgi:predicted pyridoxine 5'-phosphate oxidase superfamily flavin-nucleotide-binding protein
MAPASPWHAGERAVQNRVGETHLADRLGGGIGAEVPAVAIDFLADQPLLVVAAADPARRVWVSLLTGAPGFLTVPHPGALEVAASPPPGDPLHDVLGGPALVGTLAIEPATRLRMRLNGRSEPTATGLRIAAQQVFANCPKHIRPRKVGHLGRAAGAVGTVATSASLSDRQARRIAAADTFFIGTHAAGHGADASHRGGDPGFVAAPDGSHLSWPDYTGNSMYMTLGNLELDDGCGLLFRGTELAEVVSERPGAHGYRVELVDGAVRETQLEARRVG